MKEAIVDPKCDVKIVDSKVPEPGENEVLIKVIVSGSNPKDWKRPMWGNVTQNSGDDVAGTIHKVGGKVTAFTPGQRVAAFHVMGSGGGSFAEYAIAPVNTTFAIPEKTTYEEAAALPLAAMTAAVGLFIRLGLPQPWTIGGHDGNREKKAGPLIVYGAASAVGHYAIQWARRAGVGPILAVAGHGIPFVEKLLIKSEGDAVVDYRKGDDAVVEGLKQAAQSLPGNPKVLHAFDAVSDHNSYVNIGKVLAPGGKITLVLPGKDYQGIPESIEKTNTMVGCVHNDQTDFGQAYFGLISKGLAEGWFRGHPTETVPGGLMGVEKGLRDMRDGKNSAVKYVFKIADTPGAGAD